MEESCGSTHLYGGVVGELCGEGHAGIHEAWGGAGCGRASPRHPTTVGKIRLSDVLTRFHLINYPNIDLYTNRWL